METRDLFLASDAALRSVIDHLTPADLERAAPAAWSRSKAPTLRDILALHARDEAWVPDVIAGKTIEEVGTRWDGDLLGDDPITAYAELNQKAEEAALSEFLDVDAVTAHFSYGDYPLQEGFVHLTTYRATQAWQIANLVGLDFALPDDVIDGMNEHIVPHIDEWRALGVFGEAKPVPDGADRETVLLCTLGIWAPPAAPVA
ncbi:MAG TPA: hypothetical protein VGM70_04380 [Pseudolysinimonas sp.]|jgi:hypothetical protein